RGGGCRRHGVGPRAAVARRGRAGCHRAQQMTAPIPLFIPVEQTQTLLSVHDALEITEEVFRMYAREEITPCEPPRFTMHGKTEPIYSHVKGCVLEAVPIMGVRVVGYYVHPNGSG